MRRLLQQKLFSKQFLYFTIVLVLVFLLTGCSLKSNLYSTLTISPSTTTVTQGDSAIIFTAELFRASGAISWTLEGPGSIPANSTGPTISYTPPTTTYGGTTTATLTAITIGGIAAGIGCFQCVIRDTATIVINSTISGVSPAISTVSIAGVTGSTQVRQGAGDITLDVTGTNLSGISAASLAGLTGAFAGGATDTTATIFVTIPSGIAFGDKTLSLNVPISSTVPSGTLKKTAAITITSIVAGPTGNDTTGQGTPELPFRSLKQAASVASSTDNIVLQNGTYNTASGESFPQAVDGLTIEGESQAGVIIDGTGAPANNNGLSSASGTTSLSKLTVQNFVGPFDTTRFEALDGNGIMVSGGTTTLTNVTSTSNNNGFKLEGGNANLNTSNFSNNDYYGVSAETASITVGKLSMTGSSVMGNGKTVTGVITAGISINTLRELDLNTVTVTDNDSDGVHISGANLIKLRGSSITGNGGSGLAIFGASTVIDLGKPASAGTAEAGNNTIKGVGELRVHFSIRDGRTSTQGAGVELWAFGNDLGGTGPVETGIKTGPTSSQKRYDIFGAGNVINFGP